MDTRRKSANWKQNCFNVIVCYASNQLLRSWSDFRHWCKINTNKHTKHTNIKIIVWGWVSQTFSKKKKKRWQCLYSWSDKSAQKVSTFKSFFCFCCPLVVNLRCSQRRSTGLFWRFRRQNKTRAAFSNIFISLDVLMWIICAKSPLAHPVSRSISIYKRGWGAIFTELSENAAQHTDEQTYIAPFKSSSEIPRNIFSIQHHASVLLRHKPDFCLISRICPGFVDANLNFKRPTRVQ